MQVKVIDDGFVRLYGSVPDVWHIAQRLPVEQREKVLQCWKMAHELVKFVKGETEVKINE